MDILFVHQNFPGQFKHLAPALATRGHRVVAMMIQQPKAATWKGISLVGYRPKRSSTPGIHPWLQDFETKVIRGEACFYTAKMLRDKGFNPQVIVAHPGWGESLFLREIWPSAKLGIYCEFFYHSDGADVNFDPEFSHSDAGQSCRIKLKNLNNLCHFDAADAGLSPTRWQASTFPASFRPKITVIHDGIDTDIAAPDPQATLEVEDLNGKHLSFTRHDEVITFVNRNLEPYRGYHTFMRSLPELLGSRPEARVLIVGSDGTSYGAKPPDGNTWKQMFLDEIAPRLSNDEMARIHYLGHLVYPKFINLLQVSTVHVYLTYPFVLGWSLLEAMACGCAIVASDTAPLKEAINDGETGRLVDFFNAGALAETVAALVADRAAQAKLGARARKFAASHYDLRTVTLPRQIDWVENLANQ